MKHKLSRAQLALYYNIISYNITFYYFSNV